MNQRMIMALHINCKEVNEIKTETSIIRQICFDGTAEGNYFNGAILPGGVDTQVQKPGGAGTLFARYMLEGTDYTGKNCRLYIENEGEFSTDITKPKVWTDSEALRNVFLEQLEGKIVHKDGNLIIEIYSVGR